MKMKDGCWVLKRAWRPSFLLCEMAWGRRGKVHKLILGFIFLLFVNRLLGKVWQRDEVK